MKTPKEYITILQDHASTIKDQFGVSRLTLFGSVARGDYEDDSDIDLLVEMPPKIFTICALHSYLENLLQVSVDLIHKHSHMSKRFLQEIDKDGITLF